MVWEAQMISWVYIFMVYLLIVKIQQFFADKQSAQNPWKFEAYEITNHTVAINRNLT